MNDVSWRGMGHTNLTERRHVPECRNLVLVLRSVFFFQLRVYPSVIVLFFVGGNVGTKKANQSTILLFGVVTERAGAIQKGVNLNFVFRSKNKSVASFADVQAPGGESGNV